MDLYPLSFVEFLMPRDEGALMKLLQLKDWVLINSYLDKYISLLRQYFSIGGMPEDV